MVLLFCLTVFYTDSAAAIPLLDGLRFGSTPKQVTRQLGESFEISHDAAGTGKTVYRYKTAVFGHEAVVTCYFLNNRRLTETSITWNTNNADLYNQIYTCLYDYYSGNKYFFEEDTQMIDTQSKIFMGLDRGATGLYYTIISTTEFLTVQCVDNS